MAAPKDFVNHLFLKLASATNQSWRYALAAALAASLIGGVPAVTVAQQGTAPNAPAVTEPGTAQTAPQNQKAMRHERRTFDRYLDAHPKLAKQLRHDPSMANNPDFLAKHKSFQKYLNSHPKIMAQLQQDPQAFVRQHARVGKRAHRHGMHKKAA